MLHKFWSSEITNYARSPISEVEDPEKSSALPAINHKRDHHWDYDREVTTDTVRSMVSEATTITVMMEEVRAVPSLPSLSDVFQEIRAVRRELKRIQERQATADEPAEETMGRLIEEAFTRERLVRAREATDGSARLAHDLDMIVSERLRSQTTAMCDVMRLSLSDEVRVALKSTLDSAVESALQHALQHTHGHLKSALGSALQETEIRVSTATGNELCPSVGPAVDDRLSSDWPERSVQLVESCESAAGLGSQDFGPRTGLFADAEQMKKNVRDSVLQKPHRKTTASIYYKKDGFWQLVAAHPLFEKLTLAIITLNAIWLWVDADYNKHPTLNEAPLPFQAVEFFFVAFFVFEWLFRFMSFQVKFNVFKDRQFMFDSSLVAIMIVDNGIMYALVEFTGQSSSGIGSVILSLAGLLRLLRMCRMVRLLHAIPEIMILIKGMLAAMRSVIFTLCLLMIILYVFSIVFRQLCDAEDNPLREEFFNTVPQTMHTLLIYGTFMDGVSTITLPLEKYNIGLLLLFYCFLLLAALTVMNMLIGILCEVVIAVAATEKEGITIEYVQHRLRALFTMNDEESELSSIRISKPDFLFLLQQPSAVKVLQEVAVDATGLVDLVDFIFQEDADIDGDSKRRSMKQASSVKASIQYISFQHFVEVVLSLRGDNQANVKDIVELRKYTKLCIENARDHLAERLENIFNRSLMRSSHAGSMSAKASFRQTRILLADEIGQQSVPDMGASASNQYKSMTSAVSWSHAQVMDESANLSLEADARAHRVRQAELSVKPGSNTFV